MSSGQKSGDLNQKDISSTGGSKNSQFLSKLRFKKGAEVAFKHNDKEE